MSSLSLSAGDASAARALDEARAQRLADLLVEVARAVDPELAASVPSHFAGEPRLEALRSVLLEQDRAVLARLQQKVDDPQEFAEAVSAVLASAFALAAARDERLATILAPTMERATQASIRTNPKTMIGILYPLMGPAISKSLAETLNSTLQGLNQAFKHSFSWQGLRWRLEAYRSGSSFADVVLKHTLVFRVEHVFLIHRQTGLLLEHVAAAEAAAQDPHMVSGMLSAIQDFVRDSFSNAEGGRGGGIDSLRLGDLTLWCEEGPSAFLAAVIRGNPPESLHLQLREVLGHIHEDLQGPLEQFNGDSAILGDLTTRLGGCLQQQAQPPERQLSRWLWIVPLAFAIAVATWAALRTMEERRVAAYVQLLRDQPGVVVTGAERRDGQWHVSGLRDPLATDPAELLARAELAPERVAGHWEPFQALNPVIVLKRMEAALSPPADVALVIYGNTIRARGSAPQHWVEKARAFSAALPAGAPRIDLAELQDVQDPTFLRLRNAIQSYVIPFDSGSPRPARDQEAMLDQIAEQVGELIRVARGLGFSVRVMIIGHADATGRETSNLTLSAARAEVVRSLLRARGIAPDRLYVRSAGALEPLKPDATEAEKAINRSVTLTVSTTD